MPNGDVVQPLDVATPADDERALLDSEFRTPAGNRYLAKSDHRGHPTEDKSVWRIPIAAEARCFDDAQAATWRDGAVCWGLHLTPQNDVLVLGENLVRMVRIGKFVSSPPNDLWHGYPADYRRKPQDRPPAGVLSLWRDAGIIQKHEMARVRQGKPCRLSD